MSKSIQRLFVFLFLLLVCISIFPVVLAEETNPDANKETLLAFSEAEANRDYDAFVNYIAEDFVRHSVATTAIMPGFEVSSRDEYIAFLQETAATFPDYATTPQILVAEEDYVAFYSMFTGTFIANGNYLSVPVSGMARFEDGLIAEMWVEWDNLMWDMQMNAVESPVTSIDEIVGIWSIADEWGQPLSMEYTADGHVILGYTPTRGAGEVGTFTISDGQMINDPGEYADCETVYNVYISRLPNGEINYLRHELVGEDCWDSREGSMNGTIIYPYSET